MRWGWGVQHSMRVGLGRRGYADGFEGTKERGGKKEEEERRGVGEVKEQCLYRTHTKPKYIKQSKATQSER